MLNKHHLLSQIPLRADSAVRRLQGDIWKHAEPLTVEVTTPTAVPIPWEQGSKSSLRPAKVPAPWGKLFDQRWCRVRFPRKTIEGQWFRWEDEGEATLYINGEPWFGFDVGHKTCRLPSGLKEVWVEANCVQSAIWHPESRGLSPDGSMFRGASLVQRDDEAWHAFHDMKCLLDVALSLRQQENNVLLPEVAPGHTQAPVHRHSPALRRILRGLDEAADVIERDGPAAGREFLKGVYQALRSDRQLMTAVLTGHAHIDLVWLWPERIGELKAVHTFSTVLRLMEEYPEFRFAYSQPASYEAVRRRAPGLFDAVKKRIHSGHWQATGAMYVESDTLIACGEALLRSFLVGQEVFKEINGAPTSLTWLPDVFGYSACLPQMMRLAGVESFFTTKMTWNLVNRFPYSSFVWRGNDGSEVVAHVTQDCGYNSSVEASQLKDSSWGHQQGDIHSEYLLPTGYGDGGGGPSAEMCERARRMSGLPGMPEIRWDQPESFFARLAKLRKELPVFKGECYLEGHRGTYTTHSAMKSAFRDLERALQVSEAVSCVTGKYRDRISTWKRLIFSQFHDFIPGSSVWDIYLEALPEFKKLSAAERASANNDLKANGSTDCLFNPHAVEVVRWVRHPRKRKFVRVRLPALAGTSFDAAAADAVGAVVVDGMQVSNGLVQFHLDQNGWIERLNWDDHEAALAGPAGQLIHYVDKPSRFEAWDLDRHTLSGGELCDRVAEIEPIVEGHRSGLRVRRTVGASSTADVLFLLEPGSPLVHIELKIDWRDPYSLLKFYLPTNHLATHARFGIPYGSVLRPQVVNGTVAEAMWEVPFSRWLAVFDEQERDGLFAVTESKYGVTVRDGAVGLSLVRSPKAVGYDGMRVAWPPHLSRVKGPSEHTDIGCHTVRLAIGRYHSGLMRAEHPASLADTLFTEPMSYRGGDWPSPMKNLSGGESLVPAWAVPVDSKSWILRLHEVAGQRGRATISPERGWKVVACRAEGAPVGKARSSLEIPFDPHSISSVLFIRESDRN